ncbi:PLP-dependent aminotransferase family protein [Dyella nitratireducens]|uniref:GntR family transcriptional regulator n=1 Tax=Dyella nitratireducens TaxID=1849580 RepID=A0ABQ1GQ64_9GAMM|nr:PLP-dependent aminotransferase family protein [Dyella nitratireducens]GGA47826.1 GntR family transcriptional regulator [Dyella nitratireducens]GLQ42396.1 GntR family transcriptional regulator [Dyella nitratireducens]
MDHPFEFPLELPERGSRQRLAALHGQLHAAILDGRLKAGLRLPATRALADALGVSRNTVVAAYDLLLSEGYIVARRGAGNFVADVAARRPAVPAHATPDRDEHRMAPYWRSVNAMPVPMQLGAFPYDFRLGIPDGRPFPYDVWRRLSARALRHLSKAAPLYGHPQGSPALREAIASHISFARAVACEPDDMVVTNGAQQAFDLLARVLVTPGSTVLAVEDPGYPPLQEVFAAAGARIVGVPVDEEGLTVEKLPDDTSIIYVTPSHQFPLGVVMSPRRRVALLDFARSRGAVIIEDDYDSEFRYSGRPLDALQTLDRGDTVCYIGTFSKCLFPALRLGYAVVPPWLRAALASAKYQSDWHGNVMAQDALAAFIAEGHLVRHVRHMRKIYAERRDALLDAIERHAHGKLRMWPSDAGLHVAASLPAAIDAVELVGRAQKIGIRLDALNLCALDPGVVNGIGLGLGMADVQRIDEGIRRLVELTDG